MSISGPRFVDGSVALDKHDMLSFVARSPCRGSHRLRAAAGHGAAAARRDLLFVVFADSLLFDINHLAQDLNSGKQSRECAA